MNPVEAVSPDGQSPDGQSPDNQKVVEFSENPGRRLRVQRQSRGIEVERMAALLHLRVPMVEALEQDRYQDLPGRVFVAGYLRNYARLLGLDPEPLLAAYRAADPESEPVGVQYRPVPRSEIGSGHVLVRLISLGLAVAVIAMIVLWWQNRAAQLPEPAFGGPAGLSPATPSDSKGNPPQDKVAPPAARTGTLTPTALAARPESAAEPTPDLARPVAPAVDVPAAPAQGAQAAGPVPADAPPAPVTPATKSTEVVLSFSGPSWVNVRDAAGTAVLAGEMRKGDTRVLTGSPPYTFVIGNARVAQVTVGGRPLDLGGRAPGGVARFKLDPSKPE
jgi:cytoskeleton protein RodZ